MSYRTDDAVTRARAAERPRTIVLYLEDGIWMADFVGCAMTLDLFGTTAVPTAFTDRADATDVLARISYLNPGSAVSLR